MSSYILYNGKFFTLKKDKIAGILIEGNKIVDTFHKINSSLLKKYKSYDLKGKAVLPGFIDSHTHLIWLGLQQIRPDLRGSHSFDHALSIIDRYRKSVSKDEIIIAEGFDETRWDSPVLPDRKKLDRSFPKVPVIMRRICGHIAIANTKALKLIPRGYRNFDLHSGILLEDTAINLSKIFRPAPETIEKAVHSAIHICHLNGITSIHDFIDENNFNLLLGLAMNGKLNLRIYLNFFSPSIKELERLGIHTGTGNEYLKIGGIKIFLDGSIGAKTAAVSFPYKNTGKRGKLNFSRQILDNIISSCHRNRFQLLAHAIGDRAISQFLDLYTKYYNLRNEMRNRLEHFEIATEEQIGLVKKYNLLLSMQPNFIGEWGLKGGMYENSFGERYRLINRIGTVYNKGITVAFGSDFMPISPLYGISCAVNHPVKSERVSVRQAITSYTYNGAYFSFDENIKGKIEKGFLADIVVLSGDIFNRDRINDCKPEKLIFDGKMIEL